MLQLKMIFDQKSQPVPLVPDLAAGFVLRTFSPEDKAAYLELRKNCGFCQENAEKDFAEASSNLRNGGFFLIEELSSGQLIASAMARTGYFKNYDNLSWVMTHPDYREHGFAKTVCAAALKISLGNHSEGMTLTTDDFRDSALNVYLKLGWRPWLYTEKDNMRNRWITISKRLGTSAAVEFNEF